MANGLWYLASGIWPIDRGIPSPSASVAPPGLIVIGNRLPPPALPRRAGGASPALRALDMSDAWMWDGIRHSPLTPLTPIPHLSPHTPRSEEHTSELQSRGLISYAVFCLKKKRRL